jgi:hypothetical protein
MLRNILKWPRTGPFNRLHAGQLHHQQQSGRASADTKTRHYNSIKQAPHRNLNYGMLQNTTVEQIKRNVELRQSFG